MDALAKSVARTIVPLFVGWLIALALRHGLDLHSHAGALTAAVTAIYYALVRGLEQFANTHFGWLLGIATQPVYPPAPRPRKDAGYSLVELLVALLVIIVIFIVLLKLLNHL